MTLEDILTRLNHRAQELGVEVAAFQSNSEAELMGWVHAHRDEIDGYLVNPGGFTMFGQGFRDAIIDTQCPYIEVHWSNIHTRKIRSIWSESALGQVCGFHWMSGIVALEALVGVLRDSETVKNLGLARS